MLQGSRAFELDEGTLTPSLELGVRHDGGDAETGTGLEAGAGLRYAAGALTIEGQSAPSSRTRRRATRNGA